MTGKKKGLGRMLGLLLSAVLAVGLLPAGVQAQNGDAGTAMVDITAQMGDAFLMAPQFDVAVSGDLAESYGYTDEVTDGVSALDVAVKAHQIIFGDAYTPDTKDEFLAVSSGGLVSAHFGVPTYNAGFFVNHMYPHDGTPADYGSGYNGYMLNQCPVGDGDLVELYILTSEFWADAYNWMLVDGKYTRDITVAVNTDLEVTVQGFYASNAYICRDLEELLAKGEALEGIHIGLVDPQSGAVTAIDGAVTDENGAVTLRFDRPGEYLAVAYYTAEETAEDPMMAAIMSMTVITVTDGYLGVKTQAKVYEDFQNDLWLSYQHREMKVGDTATLYPRRVEQIVSDSINNDVYRPTFRFEILSGNSVTLSTQATDDRVTVTAVKPGTSVVKVTYDAVDYRGKHWGACSDVNTGYVVYTVGETGTVAITTDEPLANWRLYDTIYYTGSETVPFTFTAQAEGAEALTVTVNGMEIQGEGNWYTANLENRSNIIGIVATDAQGNTRSLYRVIDARYIEVQVQNTTRPGQALKAGDTANISFRGITMPVYKLAGIYNPQMGRNAARVTYANETLGTFEGTCSQWDLATNNDFNVTFAAAGSYTFTSEKGIFCAWWGSPLGSETAVDGASGPNLGADDNAGYFSVLPAFTVTVEGAGEEGGSTTQPDAGEGEGSSTTRPSGGSTTRPDSGDNGTGTTRTTAQPGSGNSGSTTQPNSADNGGTTRPNAGNTGEDGSAIPGTGENSHIALGLLLAALLAAVLAVFAVKLARQKKQQE